MSLGKLLKYTLPVLFKAKFPQNHSAFAIPGARIQVQHQKSFDLHSYLLFPLLPLHCTAVFPCSTLLHNDLLWENHPLPLFTSSDHWKNNCCCRVGRKGSQDRAWASASAAGKRGQKRALVKFHEARSAYFLTVVFFLFFFSPYFLQQVLKVLKFH